MKSIILAAALLLALPGFTSSTNLVNRPTKAELISSLQQSKRLNTDCVNWAFDMMMEDAWQAFLDGHIYSSEEFNNAFNFYFDNCSPDLEVLEAIELP